MRLFECTSSLFVWVQDNSDEVADGCESYFQRLSALDRGRNGNILSASANIRLPSTANSDQLPTSVPFDLE